jgi:glycosyltransferase involved in cell wall biosynthesis
MNVAYVSPLPPERSGVADYSALLVPALRERVDLQVVRRRTRILPRRADAVLYHIGNAAEAHGWILDSLRRRPGLVVLHDFSLHHLVAELTLGRRDREGYARALEHEAGIAGRLLAHGVAEGSVPPLWETSPERFPLVGEVLSLAQGLIVHSAYVERRVRERGYAGPVWRIPHPAWPDPPARRLDELVRGREPVIGCFGNLNASKRVPQLLEAFASLQREHPGALLVLAGEVGPGIELERRLPQLGLREGHDVVHEGRVPEGRLWELMASCDVCVFLRRPTRGETSGMAIRALSLGKPLVVSNAGWFAELPASVAAKVPLDEREADTLAAFLGLLAHDGGLRESMGAAAGDHARRVHGLERVADLYAAALEEAAGGAAVGEAVLAEVAAAARDVGLDADGAELGSVAARLREAGLGG